MMAQAQSKADTAQADYLASWPYAFEKDGWHLVHEALKADMCLFAKALTVLAEQLEMSKPLEQWQVAGVQTFFSQFCENVRVHHHHEEDHETILMQQNELADLVEGLSATASVRVALASIRCIQDKFEIYQDDVEEHFEEEERDVAPVMRKIFVYKDYKQVCAKMVKAMGLYELPSLLWHLPDAQRREFMKQEGIPGVVQSLVILPKTKKYGRLHVDPIERAISSTPPPAKKGFLAIFAKS